MYVASRPATAKGKKRAASEPAALVATAMDLENEEVVAAAAAAAAAAAKLEALVRALNPIFNGASAKKGGFLFSVHAVLCLEIQ